MTEFYSNLRRRNTKNNRKAQTWRKCDSITCHFLLSILHPIFIRCQQKRKRRPKSKLCTFPVGEKERTRKKSEEKFHRQKPNAQHETMVLFCIVFLRHLNPYQTPFADILMTKMNRTYQEKEWETEKMIERKKILAKVKFHCGIWHWSHINLSLQSDSDNFN